SSLPSGQAQSPYSATVTASGGTPPYTWSVISGALPAGLALNASTGAIAGTPTDGPGTFTVRVTDSAAPPQAASKPLTIAIAPAITTASLPGGQVQSAYTASLAVTGGTPPYAWSLAAGALPAGLILNPATGAIAGTPTVAGQSTLTVKVADSAVTPQSANKQ